MTSELTVTSEGWQLEGQQVETSGSGPDPSTRVMPFIQ